MPVLKMCKDGCGRSVIAWDTITNRCAKCTEKRRKERSKAKPPKPIKKKGKATVQYERWRDEEARPFLIREYGEICQMCMGARCGNQQLDVAHIDSRGSHHSQKMNIANVRLVGRYPCHYEETNHLDHGKFKPTNPHKFNKDNQ